MKRLLVLRPQPGADATAARALVAGFAPIVVPLFEIRALDWDAPDPADRDAVLLTSANAVRHGGDALRRYLHLPVYAVGAATARAAAAAGFGTIITGTDDGESIRKQADNLRLLHLTGREHVPLTGVERRIVYSAEPIDGITLPDADIALLHSQRAARRFALLEPRRNMAIAALSDAIAEAAGPGWAATAIAPQPDDESLLAAAARLCDQDPAKDEDQA